jgi:MoaA/NifB/PqqE/SkfB family radical SAM enzyme
MSTDFRQAFGPAPARPGELSLRDDTPAGFHPQSANDALPLRLLAHARQQRRLLSVHWEATHRCSERCRHCFLAVRKPGDRSAQARELTTAEGIDLLDAIADLGALYVTFSGGEPLLRPDLLTLVAHARQLHLAVRLYTNGQAVTPTFAAALSALYPLSVAVSLYSTSPAIHDGLTGVQGSWAASVAALRLFQAQGIHTVVKTPLLLLNADELGALEKLAATLSASFEADPILTNRIAGPPAARLAPLALRMTDDQLAAVLSRGLTAHPCQSSSSPTGPKLCAIGRSSLTVDPYGRVLPCVEVRRPLGSVRRRTLAAIWHDTAAWEPYLRLSATAFGSKVDDASDGKQDYGTPPGSAPTAIQGVALLRACSTCAAAPWCIRCHGGAVHATGSLYGPSPEHCRAAHLRAHLLQTSPLPAISPFTTTD